MVMCCSSRAARPQASRSPICHGESSTSGPLWVVANGRADRERRHQNEKEAGDLWAFLAQYDKDGKTK
jgi:hypothetical protein